MLRNYIKVALRNIFKYKAYSALNILGLGVAMALCVVGYVNYQFSQSFNSNHENADKIHAINSFRIRDDVEQKFFSLPTPVASTIKTELPEIERYSRLALNNGVIRYDDKVFEELLSFVDEDFFEMFTFTALSGSVDAIANKNNVIITKDIADKLFGDDDPVGKEITIRINREKSYHFVVGAVIEDPPLNSSFISSISLRYDWQEEFYGFDLTSWNDWTSAAFIQISEGSSLATVTHHLNTYLEKINSANPEYNLNGFFLTPFRKVADLVRKIGGPLRSGMHPAAIVAPSVVALLVLLLACLNFINTSIAFSTKRLREIGIRKVFGGRRNQLIKQFLSENLILCFIALIVGVAFAELFVPAYDSLWPELSLTIDYSENLNLVYFLIGMLLVTGLAAGSYPALYVSSFKPAEIFGGKQKLGKTNPLIRVLLTIQLALAMTAILASLILNQNAEYMKSLDVGHDDKNILIVPIDGAKDSELLQNALSGQKGIINMGTTLHLMGRYLTYNYAEIEGEETVLFKFEIGDNFFETIDFKLVEGRKFDPDLVTDIDQAIIVNESLAKQYGWSSISDKQVTLKVADKEKQYQVVGVVKDFHPNYISSKVIPTVLCLAPPEKYQYLAIKTESGAVDDLTKAVAGTWKKAFPDLPYRGFWIEDTYNSEIQTNNSIRLVFLYIAIIVVIISCMGLFALVSLNLSRRTKELGIRKVLGASIMNLSTLIGKEFAIIIVIGGILASILGYFLVNALLSSIWRYYTDFGVTPFILSAVLMFMVTTLAIGFKVLSAACSNPVEALRHE
jgi:putative ABC transport system permease protein